MYECVVGLVSDGDPQKNTLYSREIKSELSRNSAFTERNPLFSKKEKLYAQRNTNSILKKQSLNSQELLLS